MLTNEQLLNLCEISDHDQYIGEVSDLTDALRQVMARNDLETPQVGETIRIALKKFLAGFLIMEERCRS